MTIILRRSAVPAIRATAFEVDDCRSSRRASSRAWLSLCAMGEAGPSPLAMADGVLTPYAAEDIEHNTNVFDLNKNRGTPVCKNAPTFAHTSFYRRTGMQGPYLIAHQ